LKGKVYYNRVKLSKKWECGGGLLNFQFLVVGEERVTNIFSTGRSSFPDNEVRKKK